MQSRLQLDYINRQENPPIGPKTNDITDDHINLKPANWHSFKSWIPCKALHLEGFGNVQEIEEGAAAKCHKMSNWPTHHPVQTKTAINGASVSFTYIIHERLLLLKHSACCYLKSALYPSSPILPHTMLSPWTATEHFEPFQTVSWSEANLDLDSF